MDLCQEDMKYGIMKNVVNNYKHCWIWYTIASTFTWLWNSRIHVL